MVLEEFIALTSLKCLSNVLFPFLPLLLFDSCSPTLPLSISSSLSADKNTLSWSAGGMEGMLGANFVYLTQLCQRAHHHQLLPLALPHSRSCFNLEPSSLASFSNFHVEHVLERFFFLRVRMVQMDDTVHLQCW